MTLTLRIDNFPSLPDGGPIEYSTDQGGFELGRDPAMDWTLPDPNRFVSSCHAEIRFENGCYWLYDVSTNGTFVNGASMRVKSPYQLQSGDKLQIGHYLVIAEVSAARAAQPPAYEAPAQPGPSPFHEAPASGSGGGGGDIWSVGGGGGSSGGGGGFDPTPPRGDFGPRNDVGRMSDFGDQHIDLPDFGGSETGTPPPPAQGGGGGASPFGAPPAPQAPPPQRPAEESASPFGEAPPPRAPEPQAPPQPSHPPQETTGSPFGPGPSAPQSVPPQQPAPPQQPPRQETTGSPFGPGPSAPHSAPPQQPQPQQPPAPAAPPPVSPTAPAAEAFTAPPVQAPSAPLPKAGSVGDATGLLAAIADGAGINPKAFEGPDPGAVAHEIGRALRIMVGELAGLLKARAATKQSLKSGSRTMIGAEANNPLKFMPSAEEQLETMFGTSRQGYMRGAETVQKSFNDIKMHQYAVHAALQPALARLLEDMSPESVEEKVDAGRFGSKDARAWQIYVERWDAKTHPYDNGILDVFLAYFSEAYDDVMEQTGKQ